MPPAYEFRGNNNGRGKRLQPDHAFTFHYPRPATAERPLLMTKRETTPELLTGLQDGEEKIAMKFASLSSLTDSDETDMNFSSTDEHSPHPRKKRAVEINTTAVLPVPKWSNPDPYTVLPPPDETHGKKKDVVKLIRKARITAVSAQAQANAVTSNQDFISFDLDDAEESGEGSMGSGDERDTAFRSRKRTYDDEIKGYSRKTRRPLGEFSPDGAILRRWKRHPAETGAPWLDSMEPTLHLGTRLHNEILSFYNWVKPQPYEHIVRSELVSRLQSAFQTRYYGAELRAFGSFAFGVYLPTADIDLVLLSTTFMRTRVRTLGERKGQIYAFAAFLKSLDIAVPNSIETIASAKVPILKFVDKLTGLRVDLSFDNDSGLAANWTFQRWKSEFPAMPVLVSIVKQFLLLRGLNEVPTGGLGGFSIICLVTSLLQHMPRGRTDRNIGTMLMDFFHFYGNKFEYEYIGMRMEPPGYFDKRIYGGSKEHDHRLTIEDPNNKSNDISAGSKEISLIFRCFSHAYKVLKGRLIEATTSELNSANFLEAIISANYQEYSDQRKHLRMIFETDPRFAHYSQQPPPPPPIPTELEYVPPPPPPSLPPPPPPPPQELSRTKLRSQKRAQTHRDRANRLRLLRPDIPSIPPLVSNMHAMAMGGYKTQTEMDRDLAAREKDLRYSKKDKSS